MAGHGLFQAVLVSKRFDCRKADLVLFCEDANRGKELGVAGST